MGTKDHGGFQAVTGAREEKTRPDPEEFEVTLLGPGYGESIVLHTGGDSWVIVDSCINGAGNPRALEYLDSIGVDPTRSVHLIVATHWHDDHIRGMGKLVEVCRNAKFCCASVLLEKEFLAAMHALERRHFSASGSGAREIHHVFAELESKASQPTFALADRRIYTRERDNCEIWSLSPSDRAFRHFLTSIGSFFPRKGQTKTRAPDSYPNDVAVVLWIRMDDIVVLLGADLEKHGWIEILESTAEPTSKASIFKVPHHGSAGSHEPEVWKHMLEPSPYAVLTPWQRGRSALPKQEDARRILSETENAFVTAKIRPSTRSPARKNSAVSRAIRESNVKLRRRVMESGAVRLRQAINSGTEWKVETFGSACHLRDLVA